jgi:hypothetical protein
LFSANSNNTVIPPRIFLDWQEDFNKKFEEWTGSSQPKSAYISCLETAQTTILGSFPDSVLP